MTPREAGAGTGGGTDTEAVANAAVPGARQPAHRAGHGDRGALVVEVCRDPEAFAALGPEWDALYRRCPTATPFQSHAWLHSWWLSYGRPGRLRLVLVRRGGELAAVAPLVRGGGLPRTLAFAGGVLTDHMDVLIADGDATEAAATEAGSAVLDALVTGMRRAARGGVLDLREVRPGGAAERVYARWNAPRRQLPDSVCLELPGLPMDGLIARVGSGRGQRIRKSLRDLDRAGITAHDVPPERVPAAVAGLLRLHLRQWEGRGVTPEHTRERFAAHLARAAAGLAASGGAAVTEYRRDRDGEVVAAGLTVLSPRLAGGYLYGASPALREAKLDVMTLLTRHTAGLAAAGGRETLSLLRGAEPYKYHWQPEPRPNRRLLLSGRAAAPAMLLRYALARGRAAATRSARLRALRDRVRSRLRTRR
ncbi:GNAT family N-acetyltransferase [Streptomyces sp. V4-01]|uniref:GNAT family N-acetyltransferase n=1 Tax=Actinacidiphila polyblastidii TaxID=3110430 RepID=A0ABU7P7M2_9ACTN|nr:GNAT family N-acetyltransferase [Streptomyces sp. V4-01]